MPYILQIKNLKTSFPTAKGKIYAASDVSLNLQKGKITALVGESGSGKSVTALSVLRLIQKPGKIESGEIVYNGEGQNQNLLELDEKGIRHIRGNEIAMIFQEPMTSLNPVFTVGDQIMEAVLLHQKVKAKEAREKTIQILQKVGIPNPERRIDQYPHELSGGMRQRIMIAMGLVCRPKLLIADEPTTALDVTIQAQILDLIKKLVADFEMSVLLITHDMGIVAEYADRVAVMYAGQVIEEGDPIDIFKSPKHPYTKGLLRSIPSLKNKDDKYLPTIKGVVPHLACLPRGCRFQDRCEKATPDCKMKEIEMTNDGSRRFRCVHPY